MQGRNRFRMAAGWSGMGSQVQRGALHSTHEERWETNQCIFLTVDMGIEVTRQAGHATAEMPGATPANEALKMRMLEIASVFRISELFRVVAILVALAAVPAAVFAQADEIQVYDGSIAASGKFNLTVHNNHILNGLKTPAFPGGLIPDRSLNGVTEWAYGVTGWFEAGLYLPLYSISRDRGATINGGKIRLLFTAPDADRRTFFYGVNFEFSYNSRHWDPRTFTSEIRPIIGLHLHSVDVIVNPILDNSYLGGFKNFEFAPAMRVAYNLSPKSALAVEEYADIGPLRDFYAAGQQSHQVYGVFNHSTKWMDIEVGVGFGLTAASDKVTLKLMLSRDLN